MATKTLRSTVERITLSGTLVEMTMKEWTKVDEATRDTSRGTYTKLVVSMPDGGYATLFGLAEEHVWDELDSGRLSVGAKVEITGRPDESGTSKAKQIRVNDPEGVVITAKKTVKHRTASKKKAVAV